MSLSAEPHHRLIRSIPNLMEASVRSALASNGVLGAAARQVSVGIEVDGLSVPGVVALTEGTLASLLISEARDQWEALGFEDEGYRFGCDRTNDPEAPLGESFVARENATAIEVALTGALIAAAAREFATSALNQIEANAGRLRVPLDAAPLLSRFSRGVQIGVDVDTDGALDSNAIGG